MVGAAVAASARIGSREPLAARAPAREQTAEHEADPAAGRNIPSWGEGKPDPFGVVAEVGLDRSESPAHAPDEQQQSARDRRELDERAGATPVAEPVGQEAPGRPCREVAGREALRREQ